MILKGDKYMNNEVLSKAINGAEQNQAFGQ